MNRSALYAQAIRGPIILMAVGLLFALNNANIADFKHTWPLLIIVVGLIKLFERLVTPFTGPYQQPPQYPPAGGPRI
jgi:hypothetical protein